MTETKDAIVDYLAAELERRKASSSAYSLRAFAQDLGIEAATLSQLLKRKRKMTFATARDLLHRLQVPLHVRNALLLSLDDASQYVEPARERRVLSEAELEQLADWEAYAVLSALDLTTLEPTAAAIAAHLGCDPGKVQRLLDTYCELGMVEREGERHRQTGVRLTTTHGQKSDALVRAHRAWIDRAQTALAAHEPTSDFSGITMAIPKAKFAEASRRIREFRRSLAAFLEAGDADEVIRLNIQLFAVRPPEAAPSPRETPKD
jgi:DNA-binding MarR family transcriptional regulator